MKKTKKAKRIIIPIIILIVLYLIFAICVKDRYKSNLIKEIKNNTKLVNIELVNKYNYNYIVITDKMIIVLDEKYKTIKEEKLDNIDAKINKSKIIYKRDKFMYEEKEINNKYLIYKYYDIHTKEKIEEIKIRR